MNVSKRRSEVIYDESSNSVKRISFNLDDDYQSINIQPNTRINKVQSFHSNLDIINKQSTAKINKQGLRLSIGSSSGRQAQKLQYNYDIGN